MILRKWEDLPSFMRCNEVREYYDILKKKNIALLLKRIFDVMVAILLLVILFLPIIIVSILIKFDSPGPVFFRQERVTLYGKKFRIHKFRTMIDNAENKGALLTVENDLRVTRVGYLLRSSRIDEIPQLLDVISGNMSFVGARPEVPKYVEKYSNEMYATLLLPAGITSEASIKYKDEAVLLESASEADALYIEAILPAKMKYNLESLRHFSLFADVKTMIRTIFAVLKK